MVQLEELEAARRQVALEDLAPAREDLPPVTTQQAVHALAKALEHPRLDCGLPSALGLRQEASRLAGHICGIAQPRRLPHAPVDALRDPLEVVQRLEHAAE